jgi:hypothetical protein
MFEIRLLFGENNMSGDEKSNKLSIYILLILIGFGIYIASLSFFPKPGSLVTFADDAYYYLQISRNIALGNGSTFDGIGKTNGYHPLWLLILIPVHFIVGFSRIGAVRGVFILQGIFYFLTVFIIIKGLKSRLGFLGFLAIITLSLYPRFFRIITCGFEASLVILLMAFFWFYLTVYFKDSIKFKRSIILGAILGLLALARLEVGIVTTGITVILIYAISYKNLRLKSLLYSLIVLLISVIVFSPFLIWNYINFGHITTISAALKSSFPRPFLHLNYLIEYPEYYAGVVLFLIVAILKRKELEKRFYADFIIGISSIIILLIFILFGKWAHYYHHYSYTMLSVFLVSSIVISEICKSVSRFFLARVIKPLLIILLVVFITISQIHFHNVKAKNNFMVASYNAAMWAKENTDDCAIFAIRDCGIFGYFSERRTINLDGVVNNFDYQKYLGDGKLGEYLKLYSVNFIGQYIATMPEDYKEYTLSYQSHLYDSKSATFNVKSSNEVFRMAYYFYNNKSALSLFSWRIE